MTVIARDECSTCGAAAPRLAEWHTPMRGSARWCNGPVVRVKYVPETQLAGAVKALDEIDALVSEVLDTWVWPIRDYSEMRPWITRLIAAVNAGRGGQ